MAKYMLRGDEVNTKRLRDPHKTSPGGLQPGPRERLTDTMIAEVGGRGYQSVGVPELVKRAEVSRATFSLLFSGREELLLAAFDSASESIMTPVEGALKRSGSGMRQLETMMRKLCLTAQRAPGALELCTIEVTAAGSEGMARREAMMDVYGALIQRCLTPEEGEHPLPPALPPLLAGAVFRTIDARLRTYSTGELSALALALARWIRSYHPAPPLPVQRTPQTGGGSWLNGNGHFGGRAPGTLTLSPPNYTPAPVKHRGGLEAHAHRERILDAVAQLTVEHGYASLTVGSIATAADITERAFAAQFTSKEDAFMAAFELGHTKAQAIVARARDTAPTWRAGVSAGISGLLDFLASEPVYTHMAFLDAPLATPRMAIRIHQHASAYAQLLLHGAPQRRRPPAIAAEAVLEALFELATVHAATGRASQLPAMAEQTTYLALAPYLGVTDAARATT